MKKALLTLYYYAAGPVQAWCYWRGAARGRLPSIVLYYHRIADDGVNPWTISNALFERQIRWLQKHFELVSLEEAQARVRGGAARRTCVSITFDDGYADNCQWAVPWLIERGVPFTYFVTVGNILGGRPFSHDVARGNQFAPNTIDQLRSMAAAGVEIGVHAYNHVNLGAISDPDRLRREVVDAKEDLQTALGRNVRWFAFPFGLYANLNAEAFALAKAAGYAGACSAYGGFNFPGDDPFHIQRVPVGNDMIHLKNWTALDPRKLHIRRFSYESNP